MIKKGNTDISKVYLGNTEVAKIYLGTSKLYENYQDLGIAYDLVIYDDYVPIYVAMDGTSEDNSSIPPIAFYTNDTVVYSNSSASVRIYGNVKSYSSSGGVASSPGYSTEYDIPKEITPSTVIHNADFSYNPNTGIITFSNPTDKVLFVIGHNWDNDTENEYGYTGIESLSYYVYKTRKLYLLGCTINGQNSIEIFNSPIGGAHDTVVFPVSLNQGYHFITDLNNIPISIMVDTSNNRITVYGTDTTTSANTPEGYGKKLWSYSSTINGTSYNVKDSYAPLYSSTLYAVPYIKGTTWIATSYSIKSSDSTFVVSFTSNNIHFKSMAISTTLLSTGDSKSGTKSQYTVTFKYIEDDDTEITVCSGVREEGKIISSSWTSDAYKTITFDNTDISDELNDTVAVFLMDELQATKQ